LSGGKIRLTYDALNRPTNVVDAVGQTRYGYDALGQLTLEDGPWSNDAVSFSYNGRQRTGLSLQGAPGQPTWSQTYAYDAARRPTNITSSAGAFGYAYRAVQTMLPGLISLPGGLVITNDYDGLARLTETRLKIPAGTSLNLHSYSYESSKDQIKRMTRLTGNTMDYTYDAAGQLNSALGMESGGTTRLHEQFGYAYDVAGNLNYRTNANRTETFTLNALNQITGVDTPRTSVVAGAMSPLATNVQINGFDAVAYADGTFARDGFLFGSGTNTFTAVARDSLGRVASNTLASTAGSSTLAGACDLNGNLRTNRTVVLGYDDENQLVWVALSNAWKSDFTYDGKMRRRERWESAWDGSKWVTNLLVRYVYDGMLPIQERHYSPQLSTVTPQLIVTYTRGRDLSGSLQGAGGIGGLLARTESWPLAIGNGLSTAFYHADNVGNVTALAATNGQVVARYLYEPFGTMIAMAGPLAERNLFRFSSKEWHQNSGLICYGFRYYSPALQRWINRDPIGEEAGFNLYGFLRLDPIRQFDAWGLTVWKCTRSTDWGEGRHAYLWDDRAGAFTGRSCGQGGICGSGRICSPDDKGPVKSDPLWWLHWIFDTSNADYRCAPIPGTEGKEDKIMAHCRNCVNNTLLYLPGVYDCHNRCDKMLKDTGFEGPPLDRWHPGDTTYPFPSQVVY
jgi:RHS repeat-associated protein